MEIFGINFIKNTNSVNKAERPKWGLKMNAPLTRDTVSFSGKLKGCFPTKKEAIEYYTNVANEVNKSLEYEDDLSAFEALGYNVEADFETDKITIKGDYKPFIKALTSRNKQGFYITYNELGINEEALLRNVEKVTGKMRVTPDFKPDKDYVIDPMMQYYGDSGKNVDALLQERAEQVKLALMSGDNKTALDILGFETEADENGNITIKGDYSARLLTTDDGVKMLADYDINENELLAQVVKIEGKAKFQEGFSPDHYIETGSISIASSGYTKPEERRISQEFANFDPQIIQKTKEVNEAIKAGDTLSALKMLGYKATKDENGKITIDGNLENYLTYTKDDFICNLYYANLGIDLAGLLKDVVHITGNLNLFDAKIEKLDKNLKVDGTVFYTNNGENQKLFDEFIPLETIAEKYSEIPDSVFQNLVTYGAIQPSITTRFDSYFSGTESVNTELLDNITTRRDEILTSAELAEKYFISEVTVDHALQNGTLKPYGIDKMDGSMWRLKANGFMFDITDEANKDALKKFEAQGRSRLRKIENKANGTSISRTDFQNACIRNSANFEGGIYALRHFSASALEQLGYGSKADLIANCKLRVNAYELGRYFLANDDYDISRADIMDVLLTSRHNNPAIVKLSALIKTLGDNKKDFMEAVIADKINVITQNPYRLTTIDDYLVDLSDEKNLAYLKTVADPEFQDWLNDKISKTEEYKAKNNAELEEFKKQKAPTRQERDKQIKKELDIIAEQRREADKARRLEIQRKKEAKNRCLSFRSAVGWVLAPNTLQIKREKSNEHVKDIFAKHKELKQINEELMAREITREEAEIRIKALNLSKEDEISVLSYHKTCWDISGTEEWSNALRQANQIYNAYKINGIDAIEDEAVKARVIRWEQENGIN